MSEESENRGATLPLPERVTCGNGYLWDEKFNMVADGSCEDEGLIRARGWGYLTGSGGLSLTDHEAATYQDRILERIALLWNSQADVIDMVLPCPNCGMLHVDAPEPENDWTNPPHKSHLCHGCGCVWRPADVPTNGVAQVKTRGDRDTWPQEAGA